MLKIKKSYLQTLNCNFDTSALFSIISSSLSDLRAEGLSLSKDELCTLNFKLSCTLPGTREKLGGEKEAGI